jgi:hypothetical protein
MGQKIPIKVSTSGWGGRERERERERERGLHMHGLLSSIISYPLNLMGLMVTTLEVSVRDLFE